jgi:hypothetical protein
VRKLSRIAVLGIASACLALPGSASADGGAFIDLDRTSYFPGQTATGTTYVSVPRSKQGRLSRGPFYGFLLPGGVSLSAGSPIPDRAIRVGTFAVTRQGGTAFRLTLTFTMPDAPTDLYWLALCNDPCTITGFTEPLVAPAVSIVHTATEAELLVERSRLQGQAYVLHRKLRRAERDGEQLQGELEDASTEIASLNARLAAAERAATSSRREARRGRSLATIWVLLGAVAMVAALALGGVVAVTRRRTRVSVRDTLEELEPEQQHAAV